MKISKDKEYKTADGQEVRIYATDGNASYPVHGARRCKLGWVVESWTANGICSGNDRSSGIDLVEISKWDDFNIDDRVVVWDDQNRKYNRYFAGVDEDGKATAFVSGTRETHRSNQR